MLPCPRTSHSVSPPVGMPYRTHSARERAECFPSSDQITVISGLQKTRDQTRNTLSSDSTRSTSGSSCCLLASFLSTSYRGAAVVGRLLPWAPCCYIHSYTERIAGPLRALRDSMPSVRGAPGFTPNLRIRGRAVARAVSRHRFADNAGHCLRTRRFRSSPRTPCRLRSRDSDGRLSSARCSELRRGRTIRRGSSVFGCLLRPASSRGCRRWSARVHDSTLHEEGSLLVKRCVQKRPLAHTRFATIAADKASNLCKIASIQRVQHSDGTHAATRIGP